MDPKYRKSHRESNRRWKKEHPEEWRRQRHEQWERNQNETLSKANKRFMPWKTEEVELLRREGEKLSIKELAIKLGRTYCAVQMKAFHEGISLIGNKMGEKSITFKNKKPLN